MVFINNRTEDKAVYIRGGSRGGIWGFIPPQFFGSENCKKCKENTEVNGRKSN